MKISIITVVLNGVNSIEDTIKSVISQAYANIEYIVIDGGSVDGTVSIVQKYSDKISYWISEKDDGLYYAMNKGLEIANGDYVYFLNSGDLLLKEVIKEIADCLCKAQPDVLYGNIVHKKLGKIMPLPLSVFYWRMPMYHQAVFVKRNIIGRFDTSFRISSDYKLMYGLYRDGYDFLYIPIDIAFYEGDGISDNLVKINLERARVSCGYLSYEDKFFSFYRKMIIDFYMEIASRTILSGEDQSISGLKFWLEYMKRYKKIVFWGIGDLTKRHSCIIEKLGDQIGYFVDNDRNKWGQQFLGYEVASIDGIRNEKDACIFVMNERYCENIKIQLENMNLDDSIVVDDYLSMKEFFESTHKKDIIKKGMEEIPGFREMYERG